MGRPPVRCHLQCLFEGFEGVQFEGWGVYPSPQDNLKFHALYHNCGIGAYSCKILRHGSPFRHINNSELGPSQKDAHGGRSSPPPLCLLPVLRWTMQHWQTLGLWQREPTGTGGSGRFWPSLAVSPWCPAVESLYSYVMQVVRFRPLQRSPLP